MYSKRIPGDVRATMKSAKTSIGKIGHLGFVLFSLFVIGKWSVSDLMIIIAFFDYSVVAIAIVVSFRRGFDQDESK